MAQDKFPLFIFLDKDFIMNITRLEEKYGTEFADVNGLGDGQLSLTDFINNFCAIKNVADASIDANANRASRDIVSLEREMQLPHAKLIALNKIFMKMRKTYGLPQAKKWLEGEWNGETYLHDAASTSFRPYCYAYDLEELCMRGLYFIPRFNASAPKHLTTYTDFVGEFVSWNCNRTSGAVGLPSFLIYSYYFWKKDKESKYMGIVDWDNYRDQEFQRIIYKLNQPYLRQGLESAFSNFSIFDGPYLESLFGGKKFPDGSYVFDSLDEIKEYQKEFMRVCSKVRAENMMTFPVLTISLLKKDNEWEDEDFARWACEHNMLWCDSNFYVSDSVDSLSNCCRLKSNIQDLGYFNSIGGTSLSVGSVKVNTINLARIALESNGSKATFLKKLKDRTETCIKTLDVVRRIINRNVEKNLLPNYTYKTVDIDKQYNTIGIAAFWESMELMGLTEVDEFGNHFYTEDGKQFAIKLLETIHDSRKEMLTKYDYKYMINIEQVPAEQCAVKLIKKDRLIYDGKVPNKPLYSNQWIGLQTKATIQHRVDMSSILDNACSGGSILHFNIDGPFTSFDVAWDMLNYVADKKVTYFAFCTKISACEKNHGFYGEICPICGGHKVTSYQRVVGFLTPANAYSTPRFEEFDLREWYGESDRLVLIEV